MAALRRKIKTPGWVKGRTVYEVNLRQYTGSGTIKEFQDHLPRLKDLGVGILWFMPVQPIGLMNRKGTLGSYYSVSDYTAVNPEFGTLDEFSSLVEKAHNLGMKVIIDWVANHTAWDHRWTREHPEFYTRDGNGDFKAPVPEWEDVIHLDYGNPDLWDTMINDMAFWVRETGIDGFRCDMAHLVPTLFWNRARRDLDKIKPVFMLAESENHDLLEYAFDAIYNWKLLHAMNNVAAGSLKPNELSDLLISEFEYLPNGACLLNFTSNHDENSWQGSAIERLHYFLEPLTVLTFLIPGLPLIYSGQEAGNYRRLKFFDKDRIDWKPDKMEMLYRTLAAVRSQISIEGSDLTMEQITNDKGDAVSSFLISGSRGRLIVFLNLSGQKQSFYIKCDNYEGVWKDIITDGEVKPDCKKRITLNPYSYLVLSNSDSTP